MTTAAQIQADPVDFSLQRYHPALRAIWPWPAMLLEKTAEWIKALPTERLSVDLHLYREHVNKLLARLPGLNQFAYYQMFLARLEK